MNKINPFFILLNVLFFLPYGNLYALNTQIQASNTNQPPSIGNFALPSSQGPGPFFSFGQNIIDKNVAQLFFVPSYLHMSTQHYSEADGLFLYGLSDQTSLLLTVPVAINYSCYAQPVLACHIF